MELWVLRFVHISASVVWAGWSMFIGWYLLPALAEAGPSGGAVMNSMLRRRLPAAMNVLAFVTMLTGFRLYSMFFSLTWLKTAPGMLLSIGLLLGLGGFVIGLAVSRPTSMRLAALGAIIRDQGAPPNAEQASALQALTARSARAARLIAWHLAAATLIMAVSRYFPVG